MKGIIQNLRIKWGPISLQTRIVFLVFALNMSLVVVGGTFFTAMLQTIMADQIGKRALKIGRAHV